MVRSNAICMHVMNIDYRSGASVSFSLRFYIEMH